MVPFGPVWSPLVPHGPLRFHMVPYGPICSPMVMYGSLWSGMVPYGPVWSRMEPACSGMVMYYPICRHAKSLEPGNLVPGHFSESKDVKKNLKILLRFYEKQVQMNATFTTVPKIFKVQNNAK